MSRQPTCRPSSRFAKTIALLFLLTLLPASFLRAQDAIRPSLAGEAASEARRQDIDRIPYNLLAGPVRFRIGASVGIEYNDNINYADDGFEVDDFIFLPQANFNLIWPVTQLNTLRLDLGIGYAAYFDHSEANTNSILVTPGSQLAFDVFVGDFRINFHDRLSVQQDPIAELTLSNTVDYGRLENYAGVSILWDLNQIQLSTGYDHYLYRSTNNRFDYLDRQAESLFGSAMWLVTPTFSVGAEGTFVYTYYDQNFLNDSNTYSAGGFVEVQLTNNLRARAAAGYQWIDFENNFVLIPFGPFIVVRDRGDSEDFYANGLITHQITPSIWHSLSVGHESQLGVNSNFIRLEYLRHTASLKIVRNLLISTEFFYEWADDSGGWADLVALRGERLDRYGGALTLGYQLTPHVTLGLRYQYTQKDSDVQFRDYKQNRVGFDATYSF